MRYSDSGMQLPTEHTHKDGKIRVAICGMSVIWAAIEAVLRKEPDIEVTRCREPEDWHALLNMPLDVILFDASASKSIAMLSALKQQPGLTMVRLDFDSSRIIARLARQDTVTTVKDLARVIRSPV
jgi:hypothetical protein